ncbi:serpin B4-like [Pollicipes pollicipes]|uniref:serpin B4-like n=1 Tax=Pollicipes pollicipes TaxID=41117 RepID=UPI0018857D05|nr:serpin B4-like [Pollicipes pollicipes]
MMKQKAHFNYGVSENLQPQILELPYQGEETSMLILLPPFIEGALDTTLPWLTAETLRSSVAMLWPIEIDVQIPEFRIEESYKMKEKLSDLGFDNLFNLNGFSDSGNLALKKALHNARPAEPPTFICNHPFMYVIYDHSKEIILFMGTFEHPKAVSASLDKNV